MSRNGQRFGAVLMLLMMFVVVVKEAARIPGVLPGPSAKKLNRKLHHRHSSTTSPSSSVLACDSLSPSCIHSESTYTAMDHSRDPCPWVILNDFGGAFAMGVRYLGPTPWHAYIDNTSGSWRCCMARCERRMCPRLGPATTLTMLLVPQFSIRRAKNRCHHSYQGPRTCTRRQHWRLGRTIQYI